MDYFVAAVAALAALIVSAILPSLLFVILNMATHLGVLSNVDWWFEDWVGVVRGGLLIVAPLAAFFLMLSRRREARRAREQLAAQRAIGAQVA